MSTVFPTPTLSPYVQLSETALESATTLNALTDYDCYLIVENEVRGYELDLLHKFASDPRLTFVQVVNKLVPYLTKIPLNAYGFACYLRAARYYRNLP